MSTNTEDVMDRNFQPGADGRPDLNNGKLEVFLDGKRILRQDRLKMHQLDLFEAYTEDFDWETRRGQDAYFRLDFLLYENRKKPEGRPDGNMWIDDVVISREKIPPLAGEPR